MDVRDVEDLALARSEPLGLRGAVTFRAVPIAARIIATLLMATVVALRRMAAEEGGATESDIAEGPLLDA
jgi:hypothetical protein